MSLAPSVQALVDLVGADASLKARFAPGATDAEIAELVAGLGVPVPGELLDLFRSFNGNASPRWDEAAMELVGDTAYLFEDDDLKLSSLGGVLSSKALNPERRYIELVPGAAGPERFSRTE